MNACMYKKYSVVSMINLRSYTFTSQIEQVKASAESDKLAAVSDLIQTRKHYILMVEDKTRELETLQRDWEQFNDKVVISIMLHGEMYVTAIHVNYPHMHVTQYVYSKCT